MPEFFAKKSPYTDGTDFLGTPRNHDEVRLFAPLVDKHYAYAPDTCEQR